MKENKKNIYKCIIEVDEKNVTQHFEGKCDPTWMLSGLVQGVCNLAIDLNISEEKLVTGMLMSYRLCEEAKKRNDD